MNDFVMNLGQASNFTWGFRGGLLITFATPGTIDPDRFDEWIAAIRTNKVEYVLGAATGANFITGAQRRQVTSVLGELTRISIVVDNRVTRGIFAALGWLGLSLRCHPWTEIQQATAYLKIPSAEQGQVAEDLWALRRATEVSHAPEADADDLQASP